MDRPAKHLYEFGPFQLDATERLLFKDGEVVALKPKVVNTLLVLVENSGRLLEKDELMRAVWPDTVVEENNLSQNISALRKALGEGQNSIRYIETLPRRGHRFVANVTERWEQDADLVVEKHALSSLVIEEEESDSEAQPSQFREVQTRLPLPAGFRPRMRFSVTKRVALPMAMLAVVAAVYFFAGKSRPSETVATINSMAVLPFRPLSGGGNDEYLGLGMADSLITRLGNINQFTVRPTASVRKYTELQEDPMAVGRELNVEAVLDGTLQKVGDRIRLTLQLIRVKDGRHLWTGKFDEKFTDMLSMEDSISERVAEALALKLSSEGKRLLAKRYTDNAEAYQLNLKGRFFWNKRTEQDLKRSIDYFQQAIDLDPNYALAYTGLADAYVQLPGYSATASMEVYPKAKAAAARALELDDTLSEAHNSAAGVLSYFEWNWAAAEDEYHRALALNPGYAAAHHRLGVQLAAMGRFEEALMELKRARELDPLSLITNTILGATLYEARRYDEAISQLQSTLELDSSFIPAHKFLGRAYEEKGPAKEAFVEYLRWRTLSGDDAETLNAVQRAYDTSGLRGVHELRLSILREQAARGHIPPVEIAGLCARLGENDEAFRWLEEAVAQHEGEVIWLKVFPDFDNMRQDARFVSLLRRISLSA